MRRYVAALAGMAALTLGSLACAAEQDNTLQMALYRRFHPSTIEVQDPAHRGMVVRQGKVVTLMADGVSAKPFRVTRSDGKAPPVHVMDFARVEVATDGRIRSEPTGLAVPPGTRMVVLHVGVVGDRVHLQMHTAAPLAAASQGAPAYGCTEFVFEIPRTILQGGPPEPLLQSIERSLEWSPEQRVCTPGDTQLCLEP